MTKTVVIYDINGKPMQAFEYDDSCHAMKMNAAKVIREATGLSNYGNYACYHGMTIGQVFANVATDNA